MLDGSVGCCKARALLVKAVSKLQRIHAVPRPAMCQVPAWCEPEWRLLIEACWEAAPDARAALPDLARHLEAILASPYN